MVNTIPPKSKRFEMIWCLTKNNDTIIPFLFVGFVPSYRCRVPKCEGDSSNYGYLDSNGSLVLPSFYANNKKIENQCTNPEITYE